MLKNLSVLSIFILTSLRPSLPQELRVTTSLSPEQVAKYQASKTSLKQEADADRADAQYVLGLLYEFPQDGSRINRAGAAYWYKRASDRGNARGAFRLGLYYYDQGNFDTAYKYFEMGANHGFPPAMFKLGQMIIKMNLKGNGQYYGLPWFEKAAAAGNPDAENELGRQAWALYLHPSPPRTSEHLPVDWFTMAAAAGSCEGAANLGGVYFNGVGVKQDSARADEAFRRAEACAGAPEWVLQKSQHFRQLIAERRLPDPALSMPEQEIPPPRIDTHEGQTAKLVAVIVLTLGVAALLPGGSSDASGSNSEQGSSAYPQPKYCMVPETIYNIDGSVSYRGSRAGYGYECP